MPLSSCETERAYRHTWQFMRDLKEAGFPFSFILEQGYCYAKLALMEYSPPLKEMALMCEAAHLVKQAARALSLMPSQQQERLPENGESS